VGGLGQQIQPLRVQLRLFKDHPGQVAARMAKAGDVAFCQRVEIDCPEHDRGGPGRRSRDCGLQHILAAGHDYIDAAASKLAHRHRQAVRVSVLDELDRQVATFDIAQLTQPLFKGGVLGVRARCPGNDTDMEDAGRHLVRIRGRGGKADQKSRAKQPASGHSMTSSARARIVGGTVRPSPLAVFRLTIKSNLTGSWIGRSPGLAPFRMRST